jgi:DNA-binding beta-propeller fold protein YncE
VIDTKTNAVVQKIELKSGNPHSVAVNHANSHVFVPQSSKGGGCGCVLVFAPE